MTKRIAILAVFMIAVVFVAPAAAGGDYGTVSCTATISNPGAGPGDTVTLSGTCDPDDVITATWFTDADADNVSTSAVTVLGSTTSGADGAWTLTVTVPANALTKGILQVTSQNFGVLLTVILANAVVQQPITPPLAFTGSNSGSLALVAAAMIAIGGALVLFTRDRRRETVDH